MQPKFLGSYVEEMRTLGPARFASANAWPVLIVRDIGATQDEDDPAFQTKFMSRSDNWNMATGLPGADNEPSVAVGHVIPVHKREGGAFPDRIGVGRAPNVDVRIVLSQISKYHAYFSKLPNGRWALTDAGSRNGSCVQGERLGERLPKELDDNVEITFGPYRFTFHTAEGFADVVKRRAGVR